jgi:hypothetical protein
MACDLLLALPVLVSRALQRRNSCVWATGRKFTMTFKPNGKMTRQALAPPGKINVGIWKLNAKGFCTSWEHAGSNCFTVVPSGDNKWLVQRTAATITTTIAVWSK